MHPTILRSPSYRGSKKVVESSEPRLYISQQSSPCSTYCNPFKGIPTIAEWLLVPRELIKRRGTVDMLVWVFSNVHRFRDTTPHNGKSYGKRNRKFNGDWVNMVFVEVEV